MKKKKVRYRSFFTSEKIGSPEYIVIKREKYGKRELTIQWDFDRWRTLKKLTRSNVKTLIRDAYLKEMK